MARSERCLVPPSVSEPSLPATSRGPSSRKSMHTQYPPIAPRRPLRRQLRSASVSALLVSDQDREYTVGLLRSHWLTGRLTADEFEERVGEAWAARYAAELWQALRSLPVPQPVPKRGGGAVALILSGLACCIMLFTLGF